MAYVFDGLSEEERKKLEESQPGAGGAPVSGSAGGTSLLGEGGTGALSSGQPAAPSSSGWTNLRSYLDANKEQGAELANRVAGGVTKTGEDARSAIQSGVTDYRTKLNAASPGDVGSFISGVASDPSAFASNPDNVARFKALRGGIFSGPGSFATDPNYAELSSKATAASGLKDTAQSQGGQRELIRGLSPNQTGGQLDLNQLIVSGEPSAREKIASAAEPFAGLRGEFDTQAAELESERTKAVADTQAASGRINSEFVAPQAASLKGLEDQIRGRATSMSAESASKNQAIKDLEDYLSGASKSLSAEEESMFGLNSSSDRNEVTKRAGQIVNSIDPYIVGRNSPAEAEMHRKIVAQALGDEPKPEYQLPAITQAVNALRAEINPASYPTLFLSRNPGNSLEGYFPGTSKSSGEPNAAGVSTSEEATRIIALQRLIDELSPFLSDEDLAKAGTFKGASIGKYKSPTQYSGPPTINTISGGTGTQFRQL